MNNDQYRGKILFKNGKPILADELVRQIFADQLVRQKVVYLPDFRAKKKRELGWWRKIHPLQALQVPVAIVMIITVISGMIFTARENWQTASSMWLASFLFMSLLWYFEYHMRKDFDLFKTED